MAYALISNELKQSTDGTNVTSTGIDTTGADFIVLLIALADLNLGNPTISDSKSNSWTAATGYSTTSGFQNNTRFYYAQGSLTVGASHTFTANCPFSDEPSICIAAFSGSASTPIDLEAGVVSGGTSTSVQPGSITPSADNCLVVFGLSYQDTTAASVDTGTLLNTATHVGGQAHGVGLAYTIQTTATAINPTWSWTNAVARSANIASFKSAAATGVRNPHRLLMLGLH